MNLGNWEVEMKLVWSIAIVCAAVLNMSPAEAACSYPYPLSNGTTARGDEVMANFNAVSSCMTGAPAANPIFTGNVGVGTPTTATAIFEVYQSQPYPVITSTYTTNSTNDWYSMLRFRSPFGAGNGTISNDDAQIKIVRGNHSYPGDAFTHDSDMTFLVNSSNRDYGPSEAMRITSAGYLGVQTSAPSYPLHVNGTAYATGAAGALSDGRHKRDIQPLHLNGLDTVLRLKPVTYYWKAPKDDGMRGRQTGFIAQDVQKVLPDSVLVSNNSEKTLGLKYNELVPILTKAMQEQQALIIRLQQDLARSSREAQKEFSKAEQLRKELKAEMTTIRSEISEVRRLRGIQAYNHRL